MSHRRYEITLPIRFNDGSLVPPERLHDSYEDIVNQFGAVTIQPQPVRGIWRHHGQRYDEENLRFYVDVEDSPENALFFQRWKEILKQRFRQIDIWIVSYEVRIT